MIVVRMGRSGGHNLEVKQRELVHGLSFGNEEKEESRMSN